MNIDDEQLRQAIKDVYDDIKDWSGDTYAEEMEFQKWAENLLRILNRIRNPKARPKQEVPPLQEMQIE